MRVAVVADWLTIYAGAERVLSEILKIYPNADLFSLVDFFDPKSRKLIGGKRAKTSFIQRLPLARSKYRHYLPFMPMAVERFDLTPYDLIISNSHAVAKGVLTTPQQLHVSYLCARNLKYAYEDRFLYPAGWLTQFLQDALLSRIRIWDSIASRRPDATVALSRYVRDWQMHRHGVSCEVIHPPVDVSFFSRHFRKEKEEYYVTVSRLEPYKRVDLIVSAFNELGKRLLVIGSGTQEKSLRRMASGNIEFLGYQNSEKVADAVSHAKAFVFASREDFGIAPLEAQACGTAVIAFGEGGTLETIQDLGTPFPTGLFFREPTPLSLVEAVRSFEKEQRRIIPEACRTNAERFSPEKFRLAFKTYVDDQLGRFGYQSKPSYQAVS